MVEQKSFIQTKEVRLTRLNGLTSVPPLLTKLRQMWNLSSSCLASFPNALPYKRQFSHISRYLLDAAQV